MACNCKDDNGLPLDLCRGTCKEKEMLESTVYYPIVKQFQDLLSTLGRVIDCLRKDQIINFDEQYRRGLRDGFRDGFEAGRES